MNYMLKINFEISNSRKIEFMNSSAILKSRTDATACNGRISGGMKSLHRLESSDSNLCLVVNTTESRMSAVYAKRYRHLRKGEDE